jgi:hypothetical protein
VQIENSSYDLDLKNGTTDFVFTERNWTQRSSCFHSPDFDYYGQLTVTNGPSGGGVLSSYGYAAALPSGAPIGPGHYESFGSGTVTMASVSEYWKPVFGRCYRFTNSQGNWLNVTAYLGLTFPLRGQTHYGWVQLSVTGLVALTVTLTGYAYQTKAGKSIRAGQM